MVLQDHRPLYARQIRRSDRANQEGRTDCSRELRNATSSSTSAYDAVPFEHSQLEVSTTRFGDYPRDCLDDASNNAYDHYELVNCWSGPYCYTCSSCPRR